MPKALSKEQQILITALYRTGSPVDSIIEKTGVTRASVYSALKSAGVPLRERQGMSPAERRMILDLSREGLDLDEICKKVRLKKPVVRDVLKHSGVSLS